MSENIQKRGGNYSSVELVRYAISEDLTQTTRRVMESENGVKAKEIGAVLNRKESKQPRRREN